MSIRILGLGNALMSDDGFGPYVVRVLEALYELPDRVQVIDAGMPGLEATHHLSGAEAVILVDTVAAEGAPGDIHAWQLRDILADAPQARVSPHDPGIKDALLAAAAAGAAPGHVLLVGVVPEWVATGAHLSRPVRSAIAPVVGLIVAELERLGCAPVPRRVPRHPDTWWERAADEEPAVALR